MLELLALLIVVLASYGLGMFISDVLFGSSRPKEPVAPPPPHEPDLEYRTPATEAEPEPEPEAQLREAQQQFDDYDRELLELVGGDARKYESLCRRYGNPTRAKDAIDYWSTGQQRRWEWGG